MHSKLSQNSKLGPKTGTSPERHKELGETAAKPPQTKAKRPEWSKN